MSPKDRSRNPNKKKIGKIPLFPKPHRPMGVSLPCHNPTSNATQRFGSGEKRRTEASTTRESITTPAPEPALSPALSLISHLQYHHQYLDDDAFHHYRRYPHTTYLYRYRKRTVRPPAQLSKYNINKHKDQTANKSSLIIQQQWRFGANYKYNYPH